MLVIDRAKVVIHFVLGKSLKNQNNDRSTKLKNGTLKFATFSL